MVDDSANGIGSTQTRAWVDALLRRARLSLRAVGVGDAFWPTAGVWVALGESWKTLADCNSSRVVVLLGDAFSVVSARGWIARISLDRFPWWLGDRNGCACREWISLVRLRAVAHGHVILHTALGTESAHATTRIDALVAFAGLGAITVRMHHTFRSAAFIWIAEVLWQTAAYADAVVYTTLGVRATFSGVAGILLLNDWSHSSCENATFINDVV